MSCINFSYRGWAVFRTSFKIQSYRFSVIEHIEKLNVYKMQERGRSMLKYLRGEN